LVKIPDKIQQEKPLSGSCARCAFMNLGTAVDSLLLEKKIFGGKR
jgi:hypothetical protein